MDLTACQPIWVMLCRNELCQKLWKKASKTPSEDPHLNIVRFKVCIGDLTNSNFLEKYHAYHNKTINSLQNIVSIIIEQLTV